MANYIPEPIRKSTGGFKDKIVSVLKTNTAKKTVYGRGKKPKTQNIRNPFSLKKKKTEIKDRIIRDIQTLFQTDEEEKE